VTPERWQACRNTPVGLVVGPCANWGSMKGRSRDTSAIRCIAVAACAAPLAAWAGTGEPDTQLWSEVDLNYKAGEWTVSAGYRYDATAEREPETVGGKSIAIKQVALVMGRRAWRFGRNTLALRLRLDNTLNASSNPYRARIRLEYRWAPEGPRWLSYLFTNDEVFYEFQDQKWFRNRFRAGANLALSERTDLDVFYQRQDSNNSTPGAINALGLTLSVTFE